MKTVLATSAFIILMITVSFLSPFKQASDIMADPLHHNRSEPKISLRQKKVIINNKWNPEVDAIIISLRNKYQDKIHLTHIQAKLIHIRDHLLQYLPPPYDINIKKIIDAAFPLHRDEILSTWERMDQYEDWLLAQNRTLMELDSLSRSGMLWEKREKLFPLAAQYIWSKEQDSYENAQINLHNEINFLDSSHNLTMLDRIEHLKASFNDSNTLFTAGSNKEFTNKSTIASVFFGLAAVQQELQQLPPQQRQQEINLVRQQLGFSAEAIIQMEAIDIKREKRWINGNEYMKSRNRLIASNDQVSELEMNKLRSQYFGNSAITIAREEESGFYRYQRPRYYGRN